MADIECILSVYPRTDPKRRITKHIESGNKEAKPILEKGEKEAKEIRNISEKKKNEAVNLVVERIVGIHGNS